jgi:hypothetical protein
MALATLPNVKDVKDLVEGLLGRTVEFGAGGLWSPDPQDPVVGAEILDDHGRLAAAIVVDLPLAIYLGAAVGLVPPGGAQDMADDGELTKMIGENLYEVFNVLSAVFNNVSSDIHVRLGSMFDPDDGVPTEVAQWLSSPVGRLDLDVEVTSYGRGVLVLLTGV